MLCAERVIGNDPFPVLLEDEFLTYDGIGVTSDLVNTFEVSGKSKLSVMEMDGSDISNYGVIISGVELELLAGFVERPNAERAPSNLASIGRYVLMPGIFDILRNQPAGTGGEIQLADAINTRLKTMF